MVVCCLLLHHWKAEGQGGICGALPFIRLPPCCLPASQWGEMHGVRTAFGAVALAAAAYGTHALLTRS
mgnify:CR=1 FL=1